MCEGASKQTPDLKILPRRDRPPPPFEIPGTATGICEHLNEMKHNTLVTKRRDIHEDCPAVNFLNLLKGHFLQ